MGDFTALGSALYQLIDGATALPVFQARGPQGTVWPYVVFNRQDGRDEYTFTDGGVTAWYAVRVLDNNYWPMRAQAKYEEVHGTLQHGAVNVAGYALLRIERQSTIEFQDDAGIWNVGGLYRVELWEE